MELDPDLPGPWPDPMSLTDEQKVAMNAEWQDDTLRDRHERLAKEAASAKIVEPCDDCKKAQRVNTLIGMGIGVVVGGAVVMILTRPKGG